MKPKKPKKKQIHGPVYHYNEVMAYIREKYGKDTRNWRGTKFTGKKDDAPYCDFWHWILDRNEISNGCFFTLYIDEEEYFKDDFEKEWVTEIFDILKKEFNETEFEFWVEW